MTFINSLIDKLKEGTEWQNRIIERKLKNYQLFQKVIMNRIYDNDKEYSVDGHAHIYTDRIYLLEK